MTHAQAMFDDAFTGTRTEERMQRVEASVTGGSGSRRIWAPQAPMLPIVAGALVTADKAYFSYVGYFSVETTIAHVYLHNVTAQVGTQAAEIGLFSSPAAPNRAAQVMTKIVATGTVDALTGTGIRGNTAAFTTVVPAGTHVWAGFHSVAQTTEPTPLAIANDMSQGAILSTAAAGVLTAAGPWTGALITQALTAQAPLLIATLD